MYRGTRKYFQGACLAESFFLSHRKLLLGCFDTLRSCVGPLLFASWMNPRIPLPSREAWSGWQSTGRLTMGREKDCLFLYQLCRRGHNKRTMVLGGRCSRRLLKIGRVVMKFATEKGHGAVIYEVSRCQKCNFYPIPIISKTCSIIT